jgi:hypothetical protein
MLYMQIQSGAPPQGSVLPEILHTQPILGRLMSSHSNV